MIRRLVSELDLPRIRVVLRKSATLMARIRMEDGKEPTKQFSFSAQYGPETDARIESAEKANRDPSAHFVTPRLVHTQPSNQPWNPTIQAVPPGEPLVLNVHSSTYAAEPITVTLQDGETQTVEIVLRKKENNDEIP